MFGSFQNHGANAYAKVGIETGVIAASPHKLIVMLYEGAITAVSNALQFMEANKVASKGQSISKAIAIIDNGLRASLDKKVGGEIALSLEALYEYMSNQLLLANLNNDRAKLIEIRDLLRELKTAWDGIGPIPISVTEVPKHTIDALAPRSTKYLEA